MAFHRSAPFVTMASSAKMVGNPFVKSRHCVCFCWCFGPVTGNAGFSFHFNLMLIMIELDLPLGRLECKNAVFCDRIDMYAIVVLRMRSGCNAENY
jgi:hypothetical protein